VGVWLTSLLELNHVHVRNNLAKNLTGDEVVHQLILLLLEHSGNQVGSVLSSLPND
jgi:hypothetical protein